MAVRSAWLSSAALIALLVSCGGGGSFELPTCDDLENANERFESAAWTIFGFDREHLVDPDARGPNFVARLRVGDSVDLFVGAPAAGGGCLDRIRSTEWVSTAPTVASIDVASSTRARLDPLAPGETSVYADIQFHNGNSFRAFPFPVTNGPRAGVIRTVEVVQEN